MQDAELLDVVLGDLNQTPLTTREKVMLVNIRPVSEVELHLVSLLGRYRYMYGYGYGDISSMGIWLHLTAHRVLQVLDRAEQRFTPQQLEDLREYITEALPAAPDQSIKMDVDEPGKAETETTPQ